MDLEPTSRHLQGIHEGGATVVHLSGHGLELLHVHDAVGRIEEGDVQGNLGVVHPEPADRLVFEHEEHARAVGHGVAEHEALFALRRRIGNLGRDRVPSEDHPGVVGGWGRATRRLGGRSRAGHDSRNSGHDTQTKDKAGHGVPVAVRGSRGCTGRRNPAFPTHLGKTTGLPRQPAEGLLGYGARESMLGLHAWPDLRQGGSLSPLDPELLDILVCPETRRPVTVADDALVERINAAAAAGSLVNRAGRAVREPVQQGLVRDDGAVVYPVRDDIPIMLIDESIEVAALPGGAADDAPTP